jgi:pimeloyl-ACP methyl ester carboxylesterase
MARFVLVHGAWHGGWCFDPVRALLEEAGHRVFTPDLPGMGGSDADLAACTLQGWGDYVAGICRGAPGPVILCGHSRGGIVISTAAEAAPEAVSALVYICAMLLPAGMSRAAWKAQQQPNPVFDAIIRRHPTAPATVLDLAGVPDVMAQLSPPELVAAALPRLVAEPDAPRLTSLSLSCSGYGSVPRHYIECLQDRTIPIADQRRMHALQPCLTTTSIDCDHSPFLSAPHALADALRTIARGYDA